MFNTWKVLGGLINKLNGLGLIVKVLCDKPNISLSVCPTEVNQRQLDDKTTRNLTDLFLLCKKEKYDFNFQL